jgi:hypothetical protein
MANAKIRVGQVGFGTVGNYGPTHWRYDGKLNGSCVLRHVKHPSQERTFPPQFVSRETVESILARGE